MTFIADNRPMGYTTSFGANYAPGNPLGLDPAWRADPEPGMESYRDMCDELSIARRGLFQMQGSLGVPFGDYPAANWGILDSTVKSYWQNRFRVRGREEWMMYSGRLTPDSGYDQTDATNNFGVPLKEDVADAEYIAEANKPFFDLGFQHFGLDLTGNSNAFVDLVQSKMPWLRSKIFQEAYSIIDVGVGSAPGGRKYALNLPAMKNRRWLAIAWAYNQAFDPDNEWVIPNNTEYEVHAFVRGTETGGTAYYDSLVSRGFIVGPAAGCPRWVIDWHKATYRGGSGALLRVRPPALNT